MEQVDIQDLKSWGSNAVPVQVRPRVKPLLDTHCHLDLILEKGLSEEEVINQLKTYGIGGFVQIGAEPQSYDYSYELAHRNLPISVYYTLGAHPHSAENLNLAYCIDKIKEKVSDPKFLAIGEIGLDYYYHPEQKAQNSKQKKVFTTFLTLAKETKLPVVIHTRDAHEDTVAFLKEFQVNFLIHCFTGNRKQMEEYLQLGGYISFSGIVTFKNAKEIQEAALFCPLDRIFVETDAPYLTPVPYRGKINQPAYVRYVIDFIANLKQIPLHQLEEILVLNFEKFFFQRELGINPIPVPT